MFSRQIILLLILIFLQLDIVAAKAGHSNYNFFTKIYNINEEDIVKTDFTKWVYKWKDNDGNLVSNLKQNWQTLYKAMKMNLSKEWRKELSKTKPEKDKQFNCLFLVFKMRHRKLRVYIIPLAAKYRDYFVYYKESDSKGSVEIGFEQYQLLQSEFEQYIGKINKAYLRSYKKQLKNL